MSKKKEMSTLRSIVLVSVAILVIMAASLIGPKIYPDPDPVQARSTQKVCDFMSVDSNLYAFCEDGSEYRIADSVTPTPGK